MTAIFNYYIFCPFKFEFDLTLQVETMFEKYNFAGVFIQIQAVLTLYAQGAYKEDSRSKVQNFISHKYHMDLLLRHFKSSIWNYSHEQWNHL